MERSDTILSAAEAMETGKSAGIPAGIVIVTEPNSHKIAGVVTDGDLRRAILNGVDLEAPVLKIMSSNPLTIVQGTNATQMLRRLHRELKNRNDSETTYHHIVVVDDDDCVLDVVTPFELWKRSEVRINSATVVGLGFVGLTFSLMLAESGIFVTGIDTDEKVLQNLQSGRPHFYEQGLETLLNEQLGKNFVVANDIEDANNEIYVLCVNTPVDEEHQFDTSHLKTAAAGIGSNLAVHDLVVVRSTVPIGTTRNVVIPQLETTSGLTAGEDFFIAYAPERTIAGNALEELRELPQVIGGITHKSMDYASTFFQALSKNTIPVSSLEAAEGIKLLSNAYRDLRFSFANETALLCEAWGIDTHELIKAANDGYERNEIPKPSPGVGGACLSKDPYLLVQSGRAVGYDANLPGTARSINGEMLDAVADKLATFATEYGTGQETKVFLMGMAFKGYPETSDLRNSPGVEICKRLDGRVDLRVVYDPVVAEERLQKIGERVVSSPQLGFHDADCVAVLTNHNSFSNLDLQSLCEASKSPLLLFDPWSILNSRATQRMPGVKYDRFSGGELVKNPKYE
jgi:nucleotide sugar dehydrogenase